MPVDDHLRDVRILSLRLVVDSTPQRAHHQGRVGRERRDGLVDHVRLDQRFVSLHVDDDRGGQLGRNLGDPVCSALMRRRRHSGDAAER